MKEATTDHVGGGSLGLCPCRTYVLLAVISFNVLLFIYNFPGLVAVKPSINQITSSWLDKDEVTKLIQGLEVRIARLESERPSSTGQKQSPPTSSPRSTTPATPAPAASKPTTQAVQTPAPSETSSGSPLPLPPSPPISSLAPDITPRTRENGGLLHLLSHRSCSQDQSAKCNQGFIKEMDKMRQEADTAPEIQERHLYTSLPDELMNDPRWQTHIKPGVRGRGYWFWKAALSRMLLSQGVLQIGDELLYVDADSMGMMKHLIKMRSRFKEDLVLAAQPHCEHVWTKGDIFQRFGTTWNNLHYGLTQQPKAQAFLMRLNERTVKLLQIWEALMTDFHLVSDEPSRNKALDGPWFKRKENRHDQSILSMILKASIAKSGSCNEPDFKCDRLGSDDETAGWEVHPELGVKGLTVKYI
ncbi:Uncharacterized protein SCF082_LOCUS43323 [Durusdinium trenchii]|uniref:Uncharacterized protein n=1 Tax=Durusdinium trenchii TaxID=1381693 RepID=A0ABP0QVY5_9DINO